MKREGKRIKKMMTLFAERFKIRTNRAEAFCPFLRTEAAGDFLLDLGHSNGLLRKIIRERNLWINRKPPHVIRVFP